MQNGPDAEIEGVPRDLPDPASDWARARRSTAPGPGTKTSLVLQVSNLRLSKRTVQPRAVMKEAACFQEKAVGVTEDRLLP